MFFHYSFHLHLQRYSLKTRNGSNGAAISSHNKAAANDFRFTKITSQTLIEKYDVLL